MPVRPTEHITSGPTSGPASTGARNGAKRRGLLVGGAIAAVALLTGGLLLGKWIFEPEVDAAMRPTMTYGGTDADIPSFETSVSYPCLNVPLEKGRPIGNDNWVDCEKSHDYEKFDVVQAFDSASDPEAVKAGYPDPAELRSFAESACSMAFNTDKVPADTRSGLAYRALIPSPQAWVAEPEQPRGDLTRRIYCMLSERGGAQLKGSNWTEVR